MRRIGIDVGGTNTDAVLMDGEEVLAAVKTPTTADVTSGVRAALEQVVSASNADNTVDAVMIGTTHYTNAVIERRRLAPTAAIRISLPASASLPPFCDWPTDLSAEVNGGVHLVAGGHEYDGRPVVALDEAAIASAAKAIRRAGTDAVAISATFSPLNPEFEQRAEEIVRQEHPDATVTLSSALGRLGLLERENVALLNASLVGLAVETTSAFVEAVAACGIDAPLYITQNDGTVAAAERALAYPVLSFASGPTNSMRGAAQLTGRQEAMVCDVGGTTADVGCLISGYPRQANNVVAIGGVRTLFRIPDLLSIAVGGGTIVGLERDASSDSGNNPEIGPRSVGFRVTEEALVFGGSTLTCTDIAVAAGLADIGDPSLVSHLAPDMVASTIEAIGGLIADAVDRTKTDATEVPLLAVGGGAMLIPDAVDGISEVVHVEHHAVANAVGAAIAQVGGEADRIYRDVDRAEALARAQEEAVTNAVTAGADRESIRVIEVEDLPLSYIPGRAIRARVRVVGDISPRN